MVVGEPQRPRKGQHAEYGYPFEVDPFLAQHDTGDGSDEVTGDAPVAQHVVGVGVHAQTYAREYCGERTAGAEHHRDDHQRGSQPGGGIAEHFETEITVFWILAVVNEKAQGEKHEEENRCRPDLR